VVEEEVERALKEEKRAMVQEEHLVVAEARLEKAQLIQFHLDLEEGGEEQVFILFYHRPIQVVLEAMGL
jgi:hypothetical protein